MKQMSPEHHHRHALSNEHMEHFLELYDQGLDSDGALITDSVQGLVNKGQLIREECPQFFIPNLAT